MGTKAKKQSVKMPQPTLFDFIEPTTAKNVTTQTVKKEQQKEREEDLLQKLMELFEQHNRCLKRDDVVATLGVSRHKAVKLLNELVQIGIVKKRLNDDGELVYCPTRG